MEETCCQNKCDHCNNPLIELYKKASLAVNGDDVTIATETLRLLTNGLFLSNSGKICCPDCTHKYGFYFLGGYDVYKELSTLFQQINGGEITDPKKYPCCLNHSLTALNAVDYETAYENLQPPCCNTNFAEVIFNLSENVPDVTISENIIEASTFEGQSGLGILLEWLIVDDQSTEDIGDFFEVIKEQGLVIKCFGCDIFIGSVESFDTFGKAYNVFPV